MATIRKFKINDTEYPVGNIRLGVDTLKNHLIAVFDDENLAGTIITANVLDTELEGVATLVQDYAAAGGGGTLIKGFSIIKDGQLFKVSISRTGGAFGDPLIEKLSTKSTIHATWQELKAWRDGGLLTSGQQYRITDYRCTTVQENTWGAGHRFDIIVTADDVDKLNENARACLHEGDTYFANSKLEAWKLKYCLDNDMARFAWADEVDGKGVIYRMKDEYNNEAPYDFKNIQFKRKLTDGVLDLDSGEETWVYTFTMSDLINDKVVDISLKQNTEYIDDEGQYRQCSDNVIKEAVLEYEPDGVIKVKLNDNVFLNVYDDNEYIFYCGCYSNTFGNGCYDNTFGNRCYFNTFGYNCRGITFGRYCYGNTFGNECNGNTFGEYCVSNTFGDNFNFNTFGYGCVSNTFGDSCSSNTFGDSCKENIFGNTCSNNTFGDDCSYNSFGNYCSANTFGNGCSYNTFGNSCGYLQISNTSSTTKKHIHVENGTKGASSSNKLDLYDSAILNKNYQVTFKKSASGKYLMLWATDTGTMTGKVKDSNTDNTWEDIV